MWAGSNFGYVVRMDCLSVQSFSIRSMNAGDSGRDWAQAMRRSIIPW